MAVIFTSLYAHVHFPFEVIQPLKSYLNIPRFKFSCALGNEGKKSAAKIMADYCIKVEQHPPEDKVNLAAIVSSRVPKILAP